MKAAALSAAVASLIFFSAVSADAAALKAAVLGCKLPGDVSKVVALKAKKDTAAIEVLTASRACIPFAKGIKIDVDETKPPLSCIRLTGDLECYWIPDALIDQFPSEKGSGGTQQGAHHRH